MKAYQVRELALDTTDGTAVGASDTVAVSKVFYPSMFDVLHGVIDVNVSALTDSSSGIVLTLQDSNDGTTWNTVKSTSAVTTTGVKTIRWLSENATDQDYLPLRAHCRVVATTGLADAITVDSVMVSALG